MPNEHFGPKPGSLFKTLPLELITEIAKWVNHPGTILSLAYTSKHFYNTLSRKKSKSVWQYARKKMKLLFSLNTNSLEFSSTTNFETICKWENLAIPDPLSGQSEISLAQLLFGVKCQSCKKEAVYFTLNVVLGMRLCQVGQDANKL
jgi:hypothetical protein